MTSHAARTRGRLVLVGQIIVDRVLRVPRVPDRGGDVLARSEGATAGGGYNVLAAATRAGMAAVYAGAHGTGPNAAIVHSALTELGVPALLPAAGDHDTGYCLALIDDGGERTFVTVPGAEATLTTTQLTRLLPAVHGVDIVYLSGYGLLHEYNGPAMANFAAKLPDTTTVVFDPGPLISEVSAALLNPIIARSDWITCNRREATLLTGQQDSRHALEALSASARTGALLRSDAQGCLVQLRGADPDDVPGFSVKRVDSNGAGDAHTGAFVAMLAEGTHPVTAAQRANAAAALAVTKHGPATAPNRREIEVFLHERGML